jgi:hypothetical protein
MPVTDAYGERRAGEIMRETWGHMDARPGVRYRGHIIFAESQFGSQRFVLASDFGNAGYGPWFYEGICEWIDSQDIEEGRLYRFDGIYCLRTGGRHEFVGETRPVSIMQERS